MCDLPALRIGITCWVGVRNYIEWLSLFPRTVGVDQVPNRINCSLSELPVLGMEHHRTVQFSLT